MSAQMYLVELDENDKKLLNDHGVETHPWSEGILFNQSDLEMVLRCLSAKATLEATDVSGIHKLHLTFNPIRSTRIAPRPGHDPTRELMRQRFVELASSPEKAINPQELLQSSNQTLAANQRAFIASLREHNNDDQANLAQTFSQQYQRLMEVPGVKAVMVSQEAILVHTDKLFMRLPNDDLRELGEFMIEINLCGPGVRMFNLTRRIRTVEPGMHAPRVFASGHLACDYLQETLPELIAQFELATVVELAMQFVQTPGEIGLGRFCHLWPPAGP